MCGIAVIATLNGAPIDTAALDRMSAALVHRGPDQEGRGLYQGAALRAGLASRRLSILDLSAAGRMPLTNEDGTLALVYNGEVYNHGDLRGDLIARGHVYRSATDSETLVHAYEAYGLDFLTRLNGMFAFALYDAARDRLILARDPMGIKPLYYHWDGERLLAASELGALLASGLIPRQLDTDALSVYLSLGYVASPYCLCAGVRKLEPAGILILDADGLRLGSYWSPAEALHHLNGASPVRDADWITGTRSALTGAVRRQLMSDVPVGVFLSGGLDSTLVAALAVHEQRAPMASFSVGFTGADGALDGGSPFNQDVLHARRVAQALGTDHHEVLVRADSGVADLLRTSLRGLDEPTWEPSFTSLNLLAEAARQHGAIVVLTGDGSDELFGGYPWHRAALDHVRYERLPFLRALLPLVSAAAGRATLGEKARQLAPKLHAPRADYYRLTFDIVAASDKAALLKPEARSTHDPVTPLIEARIRQAGARELADLSGTLDLLLWVRDHFNQRVDRMSMQHSVEARVPFQDLEVVALALRMPMRFKLKHPRGKYPLREAFGDVLPDHVLTRAKRPFATPTAGWLRGPLRPLLESTLDARRLSASPLDGAAVAGLVRAYLAGDDRHAYRMWMLLNFQLWYEAVMQS
jgi:asparagine synthase (glutamine-hydrolysing)